MTAALPQAPAAGPVVTTRGLIRDYGDGAGLHGIDLAVPANRVYGLVGPNGAGKTTLLSILAGLRRADAGQVHVGVAAGRTAVCPDTPEFEPWLTAAEVVGQSRGLAFPRRQRGTGGGGSVSDGTSAGRGESAGGVNPARGNSAADGDRSARGGSSARGGESAAGSPGVGAIEEVLALVGLADAAKRRVGGFSRGMTQRLGLAVALALDPELLILDEPTSALDPAGRAELLGLISGLAGERTVIFSSHILADVQRVADHIGVLDHGRLLFQGPMQTLIDTHTKPAWEIRVRGAIGDLAARLRETDWVTAVDVDESSDSEATAVIRVEGTSTEAGEAGLPASLAAADVRLVSVNPVGADLEAAFLALTSGQDQDPDNAGEGE